MYDDKTINEKSKILVPSMVLNFSKYDKLNQKERVKLKKEFPNSIMISNLKKQGFEKVHFEILDTIFAISEANDD